MTHTPMTKDRKKCNIPMHKKGDKTEYKDKNGKTKLATWKSEKIIRDDDDNIIGVVTEWQ